MNYLSSIAQRIRTLAEPNAVIPEGPVEGLFAIYAVLALAKGDEVTAIDVHNAWVAWMLPQDPQHQAIVPFDELDPSTAHTDEPFAEAIRQAAKQLGLRPASGLDS